MVVETGTMHVHPGKAMIVLGRTGYESPVTAAMQLVENAIDADASRIVMVLEANQLTIIDNGVGMASQMPDWMRSELDRYNAQIEAGTVPQGYNYKVAIRLEDAKGKRNQNFERSLEFIMRNVALSTKEAGDANTFGNKAIGNLAFLTYARKAVISSRPKKRNGIAPAMSLTLPTYEQLDNNQTGWRLRDCPEGIVDPLLGQQIEHGTRVVISDFFAENSDVLKVGPLTFAVRNTAQRFIASGTNEFYIIDRVSEEAKKSPDKQVVVRVRPIQRRGKQIIKETLTYDSDHTITVDLYIDADGSSLVPEMRYKGQLKAPITSYSALNKEPWTSGKVWGFIDFPVLPNEQRIWDGPKYRVLDTPELIQWVKVVKLLEQRVAAKLREETQRRKSLQYDRMSKDLSRVTNGILRELEAFQDSPLPPGGSGEEYPVPGTTARGGSTGTHPRKVWDDVQVRVRNEHNVAVPAVTIELLQNGKLLSRRRTDPTGVAAYGELPKGSGYLLRMVVPDGASILEGSRGVFEFKLTDDVPGRHFVFRLKTGERPPKRPPSDSQNGKSGAGIEIDFFALTDLPDYPYESHIATNGKIRINTIHPYFVAARDNNDQAKLVALIAQCVSSAIAEFKFAGSQLVMLQSYDLFNRCYDGYYPIRKDWFRG